MNWEDLRCFLALAEQGSLSRAARLMGVDHTTIARHVTALEQDLGLSLVHRLPRAYRLTPEGCRIAALGAEMRRAADGVMRGARGVDQKVTGPVRVSAPPVFASTFIAPRLGTLLGRHPGLVPVLVGETHRADLARHDADLAISLLPPEDGDLIRRPLPDMGFALYASPAYLAVTGAADWGYVAYDAALDGVTQQQWLHRVRGDRPILFQANDAHSLAALMRAGIGIGALPCYQGDGDPALVRVPHPVTEPPPVRRLWLVVYDDLRRMPAIRAVMDYLIAIIEAERVLLNGKAE